MTAFKGFIEQYEKELKQKIDAVEGVLLKGNFASLEEYKRYVGERIGLLFALDRHKELVSLMEND